MISIYEPNIKKYTFSAIDAINSGWISNHGEYIKKSTDKLKEILNCKYAILMSNGTCATHCLFLSLKFKYPTIKHIYVPNNAYVAAWNSVLCIYNDLTVMNMDNFTWNINTDEEYIKSLSYNSAVLIVHNLGNIVNVPRLKKIRPDLIFIEDNCEGLFGKYNGVYSGTGEHTLCSSISFYGNKNITTGEGGAFLTNDNSVYEHIKKVYSQGMSDIQYVHNVHAYNYRMTNIQAAFLYDQLNDIDNILNIKKNLFNNYEKLLEPLKNKISLFKKEENTECSNWIFALRILNNTKTINETTKFFKNQNVDIRPFFYPINKHEHLKDISFSDNVSEILNKEIIMIPSSPLITFENQKKVVEIIYKFIFFNEHINVIEINIDNKHLLDNFIENTNNCDFNGILDNQYFKYYNNRNSDVIKNHVTTNIFVHGNKYIGYTHIDYEIDYWFGIYLDKDYRNKKLGNLFLNYTLLKTDIKQIKLSVNINNEIAINLYKKNNFKIIETTNNNHFMTKNI